MASRVRCGTVDLGGILAAECAAAVTGISAVCIDDYLTAGNAAVAVRAAGDESAGGVDMIFCILIEHICGECGLDDLLDDILSYLLKLNVG